MKLKIIYETKSKEVKTTSPPNIKREMVQKKIKFHFLCNIWPPQVPCVDKKWNFKNHSHACEKDSEEF
jgi:hypothetical protein